MHKSKSSNPKRPVNSHEVYHAHIYFDEKTKEPAKKICVGSASLFNLQVGRFHEKLVGPHPRWSCQIIFNEGEFDQYVAWLDENRDGLTVLIHGVTGNDLRDHTEFAYWLGDEVELNLEMFKQV